MEVEYWNSPYRGAKSELVKTEEWPDTDESFANFYHLNNQLKYCNGSHYKFVSDKVRRRYTEEFFKKYHTIQNYYRGGIVD
tara:strand:+ start:2950 stop:3192 length:243 start_codon:yes stop_codon:yes gene_type:complete